MTYPRHLPLCLPSRGNGVVERNHGTIKRMAARSNNSVLDMVHWYNTTPKYGTNS